MVLYIQIAGYSRSVHPSECTRLLPGYQVAPAQANNLGNQVTAARVTTTLLRSSARPRTPQNTRLRPLFKRRGPTTATNSPCAREQSEFRVFTVYTSVAMFHPRQFFSLYIAPLLLYCATAPRLTLVIILTRAGLAPSKLVAADLSASRPPRARSAPASSGGRLDMFHNIIQICPQPRADPPRQLLQLPLLLRRLVAPFCCHMP